MVERATLDDIPDLMRIEDNCFDYDQFEADEFRYRILSGSHEVIVRRRFPGPVVAYLTLDFPRCSRIANISGVAVLPVWRNCGKAQLLIAEAEQIAKDSGCFAINLECRDHLTPFYGKLGYRTVGEMPNWYEDGARGIAMWKDIA